MARRAKPRRELRLGDQGRYIGRVKALRGCGAEVAEGPVEGYWGDRLWRLALAVGLSCWATADEFEPERA